jgi:hypothetical protein
MLLRLPVRLASAAIAAVLIFAALITLQCASQRLTARRVTLQDSYAQLADALTAAGVLPLGSLEQMRAGLNLLGAGELAPLPGMRDGTGAYNTVDGAVRVYTNDRGVAWLELKPAIWRKLPRGMASAALKRIAGLDYYAQAQSVRRAQGLRQAPSDLFFRVNGGIEEYDIAPLFTDGKCATLRITHVH